MRIWQADFCLRISQKCIKVYVDCCTFNSIHFCKQLNTPIGVVFNFFKSSKIHSSADHDKCYFILYAPSFWSFSYRLASTTHALVWVQKIKLLCFKKFTHWNPMLPYHSTDTVTLSFFIIAPKLTVFGTHMDT